MKILLTGGTGFIGSYILIELLKQGHEVTVLARDKNKVPALHTLENVRVLEVSLTNFSGITEALVGQDACVHVALHYNDESAYHMLTHDTTSSIYLATEAAKAGLSHFIYTSSTAALDNIYSNQHNYPHPVSETLKHDPQSYYGATKAATENYLMAIGSQTGMHISIVRPGYTFGNPVIEGAFTQPDQRFHEIVKAACSHKDIEIIKHDGTQFTWAGDLAKIYSALLQTNIHREVFFGLAQEFTSWEYIAEEAIKITNSRSKIVCKDLGWSSSPLLFDVNKIKEIFNLSFSPHPHITNHISYLASKYS